jgi:hypothetical protein
MIGGKFSDLISIETIHRSIQTFQLRTQHHVIRGVEWGCLEDFQKIRIAQLNVQKQVVQADQTG